MLRDADHPLSIETCTVLRLLSGSTPLDFRGLPSPCHDFVDARMRS